MADVTGNIHEMILNSIGQLRDDVQELRSDVKDYHGCFNDCKLEKSIELTEIKTQSKTYGKMYGWLAVGLSMVVNAVGAYLERSS